MPGRNTRLRWLGMIAALLTLAVWATCWDRVEDAAEFEAAAQEISTTMTPGGDPGHLVIRRGRAVAFLFSTPLPLREPIVEALWRCSTKRGDRKEPFGEE